jgi:hypothetical protein
MGWQLSYVTGLGHNGRTVGVCNPFYNSNITCVAESSFLQEVILQELFMGRREWNGATISS